MLIKIVYLILIFFGIKYLLNILTGQGSSPKREDYTQSFKKSSKKTKTDDIIDAEYKVLKDE